MKAPLTIFALLLTGFCYAQEPNVTDSPVVTPERKELKGPEFKNKRFSGKSNTGKSAEVRSGSTVTAKGPEFKNRRDYKAGDSKVEVKSNDLKGPEYKNRRF